MLNQFELVWETTTKYQVVFSIFVIRPDLLHYHSLVVLIDSDTLDNAINLRALSVKVHLALFVENGFFAVRTEVQELVLIHKKLRTPGGWHV